MTKFEIVTRWADRGTVIGATHLVVRTNAADIEDYPLYVMAGATIEDTIRTTPMRDRTQEIFDMRGEPEARAAARGRGSHEGT